MTIEAVIFDMDGVLIETEHVWDAVREELTRETGGVWTDRAHTDMMGMSSPEWTGYMHRELRLPMRPDEIRDAVVARLSDRYRRELPLIPGAVAAVRRMAAAWPLAVASSSNRELIALVLDASGLAGCFQAYVASEEVERGKPAPDVYVEAARRLGVDPARCAAVEDSGAGIRAAVDAGMHVVVIPNRDYPPDPAVVRRAHVVIDAIAALTPDILDSSGGGAGHRTR